MKKRIVQSCSSHPAEPWLTVSIWTDDNIWIKLILQEQDMQMLESSWHQAKLNYRPWILKNFELAEGDATWRCVREHPGPMCGVLIVGNADEGGAVEQMKKHLKIAHEIEVQ